MTEERTDQYLFTVCPFVSLRIPLILENVARSLKQRRYGSTGYGLAGRDRS